MAMNNKGETSVERVNRLSHLILLMFSVLIDRTSFSKKFALNTVHKL